MSAISKKDQYSNKAELTNKVSEMFNITVVLQTLCKLICEGHQNILLPGPKMKLPKADFECLSAAMNT